MKETLPVHKVIINAGLAVSASQAKRYVIEGAVKVDGEPVTDWTKELEIDENTEVQVGKHKARIR